MFFTNRSHFFAIFVLICHACNCIPTPHNKKIGPNERGGGGVKTGSTDNDAFSIDPAWLVLTTCYWPFVEGLANQSKLNLETSFIVLCDLDNYF